MDLLSSNRSIYHIIPSSHFWCLAFRLLHWAKFYYAFVSHRRPLWEMTKDPGRETKEYPHNRIPIHEIVRRESKLKYQSKRCRRKLEDLDFSFKKKWDNLQINLTKRHIHIWKKSFIFLGGFPSLDCVIFN